MSENLIIDAVIEISGIGEVTKETRIDSLCLDSLDYLEMIGLLEDNLNIEITDGDAAKWHTVGDIVEYAEGS